MFTLKEVESALSVDCLLKRLKIANPIDQQCASLICFYCQREPFDVFLGKIWRYARGGGVCVTRKVSVDGENLIFQNYIRSTVRYIGGRKSCGELNTPHKYQFNKFNEFRVHRHFS